MGLIRALVESRGAEMERRLAAVMFADVVGYTRLVGEDEPGTLRALKSQLQEVIEPKILEHKGRIVRFIGDGILVEFPSVVEATASAFEQTRARATQRDRPAIPPPVYRIGINLGDIIIDGSDLYGDGVNVAARLRPSPNPAGSRSRPASTSRSGASCLWRGRAWACELQERGRRVGVYRLAERKLEPPRGTMDAGGESLWIGARGRQRPVSSLTFSGRSRAIRPL